MPFMLIDGEDEAKAEFGCTSLPAYSSLKPLRLCGEKPLEQRDTRCGGSGHYAGEPPVPHGYRCHVRARPTLRKSSGTLHPRAGLKYGGTVSSCLLRERP
jgi:hypothetical protein